MEGPKASEQVVSGPGEEDWEQNQGRGVASAEPLMCHVPWTSLCILQHLN